MANQKRAKGPDLGEVRTLSKPYLRLRILSSNKSILYCLCRNWRVREVSIRTGNIISGIWLLIQQSLSSWFTHECYRLGAAMAFYSLLSLSPLVILALALAAFVFDHGTAQIYLASEVQSIFGPQGYAAVRGMLEKAQEPTSGAVGSALGVLTLIFGASAVFAELRAALNKIWETGSHASGTAWGMVKDYFQSFVMMLKRRHFVCQ